jgi:hypothetical protein
MNKHRTRRGLPAIVALPLMSLLATVFPAAAASGGGVTPQSTPATGNFVCANVPWVFVASAPGGYVIGNCAPGWHLHRTIKSAPVPPEGTFFDGGYVYGDFNGCGWIRADRDSQVGSDSSTACASPGRSPGEFGSAFNCPPGTCSDGTGVAGTNCQLYANYRPWSDSPAPTNPIGGAQSGTFLWRYVTRDGRYVMVRDPDIVSGSGNWGFVARSCLPGTLAAAAGQSVWHP